MSNNVEDVKQRLITLGFSDEQATVMAFTQQLEAEKANKKMVEYSPKNKILLPEGMSKIDASEELKRQWKDEESIVQVSRDFSKWNWEDFLVAVKKASEEAFGYIKGKTTYGWFSKNPPEELEVKVDIVNGKEITETCFYGKMDITAWEHAELSISGGGCTCEVKKRYKERVVAFYDSIESHLREHSIYKGKAVAVTRYLDRNKNYQLKFDIFESKVSDKIILNEDTELIMVNFIEAELSENSKRTFLFTGSYGNGKTETAMRVGQKAKNGGMVFFYCKDSDAFEQLLKDAIHYQPALIFMEDVDEIGSGEERDQRMNKILNMLDGVQTKNKNLKLIFTTNHEERINKALRRPGRIDIVVKFENPDDSTREEIYKLYFKGVKGVGNLDYSTFTNKLKNISGSVIAEVAKRAVRLAKQQDGLTNDIIKAAIASMKHHIDLMEGGSSNKKQILPDIDLSIRNGQLSVLNGIGATETVE